MLRILGPKHLNSLNLGLTFIIWLIGWSDHLFVGPKSCLISGTSLYFHWKYKCFNKYPYNKCSLPFYTVVISESLSGLQSQSCVLCKSYLLFYSNNLNIENRHSPSHILLFWYIFDTWKHNLASNCFYGFDGSVLSSIYSKRYFNPPPSIWAICYIYWRKQKCTLMFQPY